MLQNFSHLKEYIFGKCAFQITEPLKEKESQEYSACTFEVNSRKVIYRKAKITPTKTGQFVTLWKRDKNGITQPLDSNDEIDLVVIDTPSANQFGHFVFPKAVLVDKGILSNKSKEGKRGFRVYPPWDITTSKQAQKTQTWQLEFFLPYSKAIDINRAKRLYLQE